MDLESTTEGPVLGPQRERLFEEIGLMAEYATSEQGELPESLEKGLANLSSGSSLETVLSVHGQLKVLCAPATPTSLRATQSRGVLAVNNPILNLLVYLGVASLLLFMISSVLIEMVESAGPGWIGASGGVILGGLNILFAAALGSSFYTLTMSQRYIRNRTFDPKYNHTYVIRFVLGLAAGAILGRFGVAWFGGEGADGIVGQLGPAAFAIVGGYSAEAVSQILKRIAETLVTLVRGGQEDQIDARAAELRAHARERMAQERESTLARLHDAKEAALQASASEEVLSRLDEAIADLRTAD